ncbi:MAG: excinuclease ABC subunit UvrB [Candidatus Spechtbacterales bacterium]
MNFELNANFKPRGDQIKAIKELGNSIKNGAKDQVLYGVTGSGKTYTAANIIAQRNKSVLVISHNKMLAWQLYQEFKEFFPKNSVHYFVSYYDYYQPEAYIPQTDTYIAKDASINKKIDKMRHAAVQSLLTRNDTIIVASVSCIYNIGSPETYQKVILNIKKGQKITRKKLLSCITGLGFARNDFAPEAGNFRAKGGAVEIHPATGENPVVVELEKDAVEKISRNGVEINSVDLYPANFWVAPQDKLKIATENIRTELQKRLEELKKQKKEIEAYRLEKKTNYDLEMMEQMGYCPGIENYSRHIDFREPDDPPFTLLDYMPKEFLTIIDESHMTIPQIRGMYAGDRARKETLINHGFRLPSALDNRPFTFEEFENRRGQTLYMSATPNPYEIEKSKGRVYKQIVRPTGLLDPKIEIRKTNSPSGGQMTDVLREIQSATKKGHRAIVVTITKRLAEHIAEYMEEKGLKVNYIHSEVPTLKRPLIIQKLREGKYDVLVGVNLLREGLDFPEVSLVVILDADKEGFLRNETTLLQTVGRAARHVDGRAIMYADKITGSMKKTILETNRRRSIQMKYNEEHGIKPSSINKKIYPIPRELLQDEDEEIEMDKYKNMAKKELEKEMEKAAKELNFEKAVKLRDEIKKL